MLLFSLILIQLIIFIGLILVFRRVLSSNVNSATQHLAELNEDYDKKEREVNTRLEEARRRSGEIVAKAREEAEKEREKVAKEAETERDKILREARTSSEEIMQQADKSRRLLLSELDERISKEAAKKAAGLIQRALPEEFKRDIHHRWMKELAEDSLKEIERLRIPEEVKDVKITSAFSLRDDERKNLSKRLKELLGREVALKEEVNTEIVAGLVVTIGSLILDGSLKNKIREHAENIGHEDGE